MILNKLGGVKYYKSVFYTHLSISKLQEIGTFIWGLLFEQMFTSTQNSQQKYGSKQ